jgi:hypothetical protein
MIAALVAASPRCVSVVNKDAEISRAPFLDADFSLILAARGESRARSSPAGGERSTCSVCRTKVFRMAMGQRTHEEQAAMWVAVSELPRSVSHPFYEKERGRAFLSRQSSQIDAIRFLIGSSCAMRDSRREFTQLIFLITRSERSRRRSS